jgi:hypothetical protein
MRRSHLAQEVDSKALTPRELEFAASLRKVVKNAEEKIKDLPEDQ